MSLAFRKRRRTRRATGKMREVRQHPSMGFGAVSTVDGLAFECDPVIRLGHGNCVPIGLAVAVAARD
jgi:hypothetical protein